MQSKMVAILLGTLLLQGGLSAQTPARPQAANQTTPKAVAKYGSNPAVGKTFMHDGIKLYYEVYGGGEPLLLVHGNGGSIADFKAQIDYFRKGYKVIAMDSRD